MPPTWEWSNELTLKFLKHLSKENALWDLNDPRHKEKYKVQEAWDRISTAMGMPVDELKMKKTSLMASWRPLVRKKVASIESATHEDEIYQPSWFAYDVMERFLGKLYGIEQTIKPEYDHEETVEFAISPSPSDHSDISSPPPIISKIVTESLSCGTKKAKKNEEDYSEAPKNSGEAPDPLHQVSKAKIVQRRCLRTQEDEEDECVLYTKLLEKKLRRYPPRMRDRIMHKIDGLLLDNPYPETPNCSSSVPQQVPYQCYRNSPPSPVYVTTLHNTQADASVKDKPQKSIEIQTDMTYKYVDMNSLPRNSASKNNL